MKMVEEGEDKEKRGREKKLMGAQKEWRSHRLAKKKKGQPYSYQITQSWANESVCVLVSGGLHSFACGCTLVLVVIYLFLCILNKRHLCCQLYRDSRGGVGVVLYHSALFITCRNAKLSWNTAHYVLLAAFNSVECVKQSVPSASRPLNQFHKG